MVSDYFTRPTRFTHSTALTGIVVASLLALGACRTAGDGATADTAEPATTETAAADDSTAATPTSGDGDIVETATAAGDFTTLVRLLDAAGLTATLQGDGPYTVFAPTDAAFAALPAGTVDALMLSENRDRLAQILSYHVVSGQDLTSADVAGQTMTVATLEGRDIEINGSNGVKVNNATVTAADVDATNGVIHVIDTVLIP